MGITMNLAGLLGGESGFGIGLLAGGGGSSMVGSQCLLALPIVLLTSPGTIPAPLIGALFSTLSLSVYCVPEPDVAVPVIEPVIL